MIAPIIFLFLLASLLICCSWSQIYYEEGFDISGNTGVTGSTGPSGSTGSTGSTGPTYYDNEDNADEDEEPIGLDDMHHRHRHRHRNYHNHDDFDQDNYILKTMIVPPICPACPSIIYPDANAFETHEEQEKRRKLKDKESKPAPVPSKYPSQINTSSYNNLSEWSTTPYPVVKDFTTFGM